MYLYLDKSTSIELSLEIKLGSTLSASSNSGTLKLFSSELKKVIHCTAIPLILFREFLLREISC